MNEPVIEPLNEPEKKPTNWVLYSIAAAVILTVLAIVWKPDGTNTTARPDGATTEQVTVSRDSNNYQLFLQDIDANKIEAVHILADKTIEVKLTVGTIYKVNYPSIGDTNLMNLLSEHKEIKIITEPSENKNSFLMSFGPFIFFVIAIVLISVWQTKKQQKMQKEQMEVQKEAQDKMMGSQNETSSNKAEKFMPGEVPTRFKDVAGVDKSEVTEVLDFLHNPAKYTKLKAKMPRGVLLVGSPGCGKTLMAKAIAGEAGAAFFSISGSDFVEKFVGVGAGRVRSMFKEARDLMAPCIIFIDEIDGVGRSRSSGHNGQTNDEREGTLNQLLKEMDGFAEHPYPIVVVAATNRPDILDAALTRPGRFDRTVTMPALDMKGRAQVLTVHTVDKGMPLAPDVDLDIVARQYTGASGADLANLANEAAMIAVKKCAEWVTMQDFEEAKDKIIMGKPTGNDIMSPKEKRLTAYHEAGHAIVGRLVPGHDPVYKVSILPRGRALGVTVYLPDRERVSLTFKEAEGMIASLYGGRAAEDIIYGSDGVTTGASNDYERATQLISAMITQYGLYSKVLGHQVFATTYGDQLATGLRRLDYSEDVAIKIDQLKRDETDRIYEYSKGILMENREILEVMTEALLKWETIDRPQIDAIMEGKSLENIPEPLGTAGTKDAVAKEQPQVVLEKEEGKEQE